MVGLAISVGAAGNVHGRGSGALRLRSRDRVHLVYGRGGPPPPTVYTFIYRSVAICGCVRRVCSQTIGLGYIFVATACADDPPER